MRKERVWNDAYQKGVVAVSEEIEELPFLKLRRNYRVLDIGCGKGALLANLVQQFDIEGFGIDVVLARERRFDFLKADAQNLPFRDGAFDVVYSLGVIEHLASTEKAIFESFRVLRNSGQALFTVPNTFSLHTFLGRPLRRLFGLWQIGLERSLSLSELQDMLGRSGFRHLEHKIIFRNVKRASLILKAYASFDNFLNKLFDSWGFFMAVYCSK